MSWIGVRVELRTDLREIRHRATQFDSDPDSDHPAATSSSSQ